MVFHVFILIFLFRSNGKSNIWIRTIIVKVMGIISKMPFWKLLDISFKFLNNYEARWQQHLKDTLQLKTLRTWINVRINSFLDKYDKTKMGEGALEIISCPKGRTCSLKNIAQNIVIVFALVFCSEKILAFKFHLVLIE